MNKETRGDYSVKITFRNARILNAIKDAGYKSQAEFARAAGMPLSSLNSVVAMRKAPINETGRLCKAAQDILDGLCLLPEDLWTERQLYAGLPRNTATVEISESEALSIAAMDNKKRISFLIDNSELSVREKEVIKLRFGNSEPTHKEIGAAMDVTSTRVRQIEVRALSKLRAANCKTAPGCG